jgi:hypothetical protein
MQTTEGTKMKIVQKLGGSHVFQHLLGQIKKHGLKIRAERIHYGKTCSVFFFSAYPSKNEETRKDKNNILQTLGETWCSCVFSFKVHIVWV